MHTFKTRHSTLETSDQRERLTERSEVNSTLATRHSKLDTVPLNFDKLNTAVDFGSIAVGWDCMLGIPFTLSSNQIVVYALGRT